MFLCFNRWNVWICRASKESDMKVFIGSQICNVTSLSLNQVCLFFSSKAYVVTIFLFKSFD
jgi:hypothetical protein